jgi:menaquinone-dependent protoporphyrinogen oxidase
VTTLILFSTTDGHTLSICQRIAEILHDLGETAIVESIENTNKSPADFGKTVIGASIRYGHHKPAVYDYINQYAVALASTRSVFFSVNLVARKPGRNEVATNPYMKKFLKKIPWQPAKIKIFAGKLNYPKYSFLDKWIIRFIMWLTKGPTDLRRVTDFTDWQAVDNLANEIASWK